jgi:hypothetical protein
MKQKKQKPLMILSVIFIVMGLLISVGSAISYYDRMCSCPAQIVEQPSVPCCIDTNAIYLIYLGIILMVIGIILLVKITLDKK